MTEVREGDFSKQEIKRSQKGDDETRKMVVKT